MALFDKNLIRGIVDRQASLLEDSIAVFEQGTNFYTRITRTEDPDLEIGGLEAANAVDQKLASDTLLDEEFNEIVNWINTVVTSVPPTVGGTAFTSFDLYLASKGFRVHETFKNVYNHTITQTTQQIVAASTYPREVLFGTLSFTASHVASYTDRNAVNTSNAGQTMVGAYVDSELLATGIELRVILADGLSGQTTERVKIDGNPLPLDTNDLLAISLNNTYVEAAFVSCIAFEGNLTAGASTIILKRNGGATQTPVALSDQELNILDSNNQPMFNIGDHIIVTNELIPSPYEVHTLQSVQLTSTRVNLGLSRPLDNSYALSSELMMIRTSVDTPDQGQVIGYVGRSGTDAFESDVLANAQLILLFAASAGVNSGKLPEINTLDPDSAPPGTPLFKPGMKFLLEDDLQTDSNLNQEINCVLTVTVISGILRITTDKPVRSNYTIANNARITRLYTDILTVQSSATGVAGYNVSFKNVPDREPVA